MGPGRTLHARRKQSSQAAMKSGSAHPETGTEILQPPETGTESFQPTVGIIEDDEGIREVLRQLLEGEGYHVLEAAHGPAGLALLRSYPERMVVLLDHKLPALDGCDLVDIVAKDATLRTRHAIIFVTARPQHAEQECGETLDELDAPLLPKPFNIEDVLDAVAEAAQRLRAA